MKKLFFFSLLLMCSVLMIAQEKPSPVTPVFEENLFLNSENQPNSNVYTDGFANLLETFTYGGDRLVAMQYTDGGWGWPLNAPPTYGNILGPIAMGLAQAYQQTGIATHNAALLNSGAYLLTKINNFSPSDGYLAAQLDKIFGGNTYTSHVVTNFYNPLVAGTYNRNGAGTLYNTADYVNLIRTNRSGSQANLAAWDLGMGLVGASMCGANTAEWIAGVKAEINELNGDYTVSFYDVIGLAGAIYGLAFVNEDFDPTSGQHATANNIDDLANILASYQIAGGGFAWNQAYVIPNDGNEAIQETAYSILALNEVNRPLYLINIQDAANYMMNVQLVTGGWRNGEPPNTDTENNEITAEALWGISVAYPAPVYNLTKDVYYPTIQSAINDATAGNTITVAAGTYPEIGQIVIDKDLSIVGEDKTSTIINPTSNTGSSGDSRGWWLVNAGIELNLSNVTLDGNGLLVYQGIRHLGKGTISNCDFINIKYNESGPEYAGVAIAAFGSPDMNVNIANCNFSEIGRVGVLYFGTGISNSMFINNTYVGKGDGDWLDYALDISAGAIVNVENCDISNNKGIASVDGSTSAGILVSTYFGAGTKATITNSALSNNTTGIAVGYDASDGSTVIANNNNIISNTDYGITSTNPFVNAENNWWGTAIETEIQALLSGPVDYDPWIGKAETVSISQATPVVYDFPVAGVKMVFNTLPAGGGNVIVSRYNEAPTPFPNSYTNVGLWLDITSTMPNYSFNADVSVDVFGIPGFDATTTAMYFNSTTNSWIAIPGGVYLASDPSFGGHPSFSFITNHFTPFTFINTPSTAYNVYLSSSTNASAGSIYPNDAWGFTNALYEPNDWDFTAPIELYIVPEAGSVFGASDITIQWDNTLFSYVSVDKTGGIYDGANFQFLYNQLGTTDQVTINASSLTNTNFNTVGGDFIAKLNLNLLKPGFGPISFTALDFRAFDGLGGQLGVYVTGNNAQVKSYLGDVSSPGPDASTGDGLVNFEDLSLWSSSYWSGVPGYVNGMANYKVKYDVGPTTTNTVYGLPTTDGKIQFEDLVIFSMSYGLSANHVYPKLNAEPTEPVELKLGNPIFTGNQTRVPLFVSGGVQNVRAMNLTFAGEFGKLVGVEKGELLTSLSNPVMVLNNVEGNQVFVDLAVFGASEFGISNSGEVLTLVFEGNADININSANIRNILNGVMKVNISGSIETIPAEFALLQNYPNPFNPSTTISYNLPKQAMVEISVFNALGERVATLVNELKEAGRYNVELNAAGYSSGIYFYQIKANDFVSVKKMILMK